MTTLQPKAMSAKVNHVNVNEKEWVIKGTCTSLPEEIIYRKIKKIFDRKSNPFRRERASISSHFYRVDRCKAEKRKSRPRIFCVPHTAGIPFIHKLTPHLNNWEIYIVLSDGSIDIKKRLRAPASDKLYMEKLYYGDRAF